MSQHTGNVPAEGAQSPMIPELPGEIRATLAPEVQAHIEALEAAQRDLRQEVDRLTVFRQLAYKDDLTGLYNRRHFGERLAQEWSRSTRFDEPLTRHTYYRIGGPAPLLAIPRGEADLRWLRQGIDHSGVDWFVLGLGSNLNQSTPE